MYLLVKSTKQFICFLRFEDSRKFVPAKFFNRAIRESLSPRNANFSFSFDVRESLYPRKFLPAKLSANKVLKLIYLIKR